MKGRVHYVSPKGSTEKIAEAIANECRIVKEPLMPAYMPEGIALMFLGCEGTKVDKVTMEFVKSIDKKRVSNAALFSTNPGKKDDAIKEMRTLLEARGVSVLSRSFVCQGKALFGKHPGADDIQAARKFAAECVKEVMGD
jgi:hypothetical protein